MNITQMNCFLSVAETLSFARSAEQLNITQPAVTHQIRSLEKELNVKLFDRDTHSVSLTKAGFMLLDDARLLVRTSDRVKRRFETMNLSEIHELRIACHFDGYLQTLPDLIRKYHALNPSVKVYLQFLPTQPLLYRFLAEEKTDLVLAGKDPGSQSNIPGTYRELLKTPLVCVCAASHPFADCTSISDEQLRTCDLILYEPSKETTLALQFQNRMLTKHDPHKLHFCTSTMSGIILAKAGMGVFLLPEAYVPADPALTTVPLEKPTYLSSGVYLPKNISSPHINSFLTLIEQEF